MPVAISNLSATWSNSNLAFTAISMNVANNGSNADSRLFDLKVDGSSRQYVTPNGDIYITGYYHGDGSMLTGIIAGGGSTDNIARLIANTAYDKANSANILAFQVGGAVTTANTIASAAYDKANAANLLAFSGGGSSIIASAAFDKANAANLLAFNTGAGANTYLLATIAGANTAVGAGANAYANLVWSRSNTFTSATIAGANTAVGTGANAFTSATIAGANTAVGTGANTFLLATIAGANTAVGTGANAFSVATFSAANNTPVGNTLASLFTSRSTRRSLNFLPGTNITINVDDDSAGDRANITVSSTAGTGDVSTATLNGANTAVGAGANAFTSATIAGANTAVGTGANTVGIAAFNKANSTTYTSNVVISVADNTNAALRITQTGTGEAIRVEDNANPDSTPFVVDANGNVGIGTSSPGSKLDVVGFIREVANFGDIRMITTDNRGWRIGTTSNGTTLGSFYIQGSTDNFTTSFINGLYVIDSGNVGIGTSSPTTLLSVNGVASFGAGTAALPSVAAFGDLDTGMWFPATNTVAWSTGGSERLRIASGGNVGIGTSSPVTRLQVSTSGYGDIQVTDTSVSRSAYVGYGASFAYFGATGVSGIAIQSNSTNRILIDSSGNVGIGTSSPTQRLDVNGAINASAVLVNGQSVLETIAGANTDVGTGANTYLSATIAGANTAVGNAANNFSISTFGAANNTPVGNTLASTFTSRSTRRSLNFIPGTNITINIDDDSAGNRANITISSTSGGDVTTATLNGANTAVGAGANTYLLATIAGANTAVGTGANTYLLATIAGANTAVGTGANTYLLATIAGSNTAVGTGANAFTSVTIAGANTAVGNAANNFASATIAGANTAVGTAANNFSIATFGAANNTPVGNTLASLFTSRSTRRSLNFIPGTNITINVDDDSAGNRANITVSSTAGSGDVTTATLNGANTAVGGGANAFTSATIAGANTAVGTGANAFTSATIAGANTAVGAGANTVAAAAFAKANATTYTSNVVISVADNTNAALRITQTGTGDALRVEDSANPDASPFVVDANGSVLIGTTSARSNFLNASLASAGLQIEGIASTNSSMSIVRDGASSNPPRMFLAKSRGATVGSNGLVQSGDILGSISFEGNDGAEFVEGAKIDSVVDGTAASDSMPSRLEFHTSSAASLIERMRIDASGNVGIGTTSPAYKLEVAGSFAAQTKSFVINHPTKEGQFLRYGSLEGPENGVYVRGKLEGKSIIELPDYWWNLVDENTITVNLTPYGRSQDIWVQSTSSHFIYLNQPADCFFTVFAERKDVDKLVVEY